MCNRMWKSNKIRQWIGRPGWRTYAHLHVTVRTDGRITTWLLTACPLSNAPHLSWPSFGDVSKIVLLGLQGVSKKRYFLDFLSYFSSRGWISLVHMCFGIRILSPFHLAIQKVSIQNLNCPKNACADMIFIPALRSENWAKLKIMSAYAFLAFLAF